MSLLTWNFDKNFIYVIIYWALEIILRIFLILKEEYFKMSKNIVHNEYMFVIFLNIADLLSGFFVLYMKCASKSKNNKISNKKEARTQSEIEIDLIYEKSRTVLKKSFYKKLIIIVILDYISRSSFWISYAITGAESDKVSHTLQKNITITLDILMRYIFSVFILKVFVYKHRIFSMIIICIGFIILILNDLILMIKSINKEYDISETFLYTLIVSISAFLYPYEDTLVKQIFSEDYLYPANMQFDRGIIEMLLLLVLTPILFFSFKQKLEFNFDIIVTTTMIFYTLTAFFKAYILLKIIYHYSSQSVSFLIISQSFGGFISRFVKITKEEKESNEYKYFLIILEFIGILIALFATLVYDEIIIINKWELNNNVKIGIINRGELEMKNLNYVNVIDNENVSDNVNYNNENRISEEREYKYNENEYKEE